MTASVFLGVLRLNTLLEMSSLSVFWIPNPIGIVSYSFDFAFLIPFVIAMICVMLKSVGNISLLNAYTKEGRKNTLQNGLMSEGAGIVIAGALGGVGIGSSSGATGLVVGTGIASRRIGLGLGFFFDFVRVFAGDRLGVPYSPETDPWRYAFVCSNVCDDQWYPEYFITDAGSPAEVRGDPADPDRCFLGDLPVSVCRSPEDFGIVLCVPADVRVDGRFDPRSCAEDRDQKAAVV